MITDHVYEQMLLIIKSKLIILILKQRDVLDRKRIVLISNFWI